MTESKPRSRGLPGWLVALVLCTAALGLALLAWTRLNPASTVAGPPEADIVVKYEGRNWVPVDPSLAAPRPADQMVRVGIDGRHTLWADRAEGIGGGGGPATEGLRTGAYHRIYVQLEDGRYLPMRWLIAD